MVLVYLPHVGFFAFHFIINTLNNYFIVLLIKSYDFINGILDQFVTLWFYYMKTFGLLLFHFMTFYFWTTLFLFYLVPKYLDSFTLTYIYMKEAYIYYPSP